MSGLHFGVAPKPPALHVRDRPEWPSGSIAAFVRGAPMIMLDGIWYLDGEPKGGNDRHPGAVILRVGTGEL